MTTQETTNLINHKAADLQKQYTNIAVAQGNGVHSLTIFNFEKSSNMQKDLAENKVNKISEASNGVMTPSASAEIDEVLRISRYNITQEQTKSTTSFMNSIKLKFNYILLDFKATLNKYVASITALPGLFAAAVDTAVANFTASLATLMNNIVASFLNLSTNIYNAIIGQVNALVTKFNRVGEILAEANKKKETVYNFYKRAKGLASTSPYIQANVPDKKGSIQHNSKALPDTPDSKIMIPKLSTDSNRVTQLLENPLASILGRVSSLIPSKSETKISEPISTQSKNIYGQTLATTDKGGNSVVTTTTPGNVTKTIIHPSGSNDRVLDDGTKINKTVSDKIEMTDGDWKITTSKDKVEIVVGDCKVELRKNSIYSITENSDISVGGKLNSTVKGDVYQDYKSNMTEKISGNLSQSINGGLTQKIDGQSTVKIGGASSIQVGSSLSIQVTGNVNLISGGNVIVAGATGVTLKGAAGTLKIM